MLEQLQIKVLVTSTAPEIFTVTFEAPILPSFLFTFFHWFQNTFGVLLHHVTPVLYEGTLS